MSKPKKTNDIDPLTLTPVERFQAMDNDIYQMWVLYASGWTKTRIAQKLKCNHNTVGSYSKIWGFDELTESAVQTKVFVDYQGISAKLLKEAELKVFEALAPMQIHQAAGKKRFENGEINIIKAKNKEGKEVYYRTRPISEQMHAFEVFAKLLDRWMPLEKSNDQAVLALVACSAEHGETLAASGAICITPKMIITQKENERNG